MPHNKPYDAAAYSAVHVLWEKEKNNLNHVCHWTTI